MRLFLTTIKKTKTAAGLALPHFSAFWKIVLVMLLGFAAEAMASPAVVSAKVESKADHISVALTFKEKVDHQLVKVRGTHLISLDLEGLQVGSELKGLSSQVKSNNLVLKKIRVSNFSTTVARLVFHLKTDIKPPVVKTSNEGSNYRLVISFYPMTQLVTSGGSDTKDKSATPIAKKAAETSSVESAKSASVSTAVASPVPRPDIQKTTGVAPEAEPAKKNTEAVASNNVKPEPAPKAEKSANSQNESAKSADTPAAVPVTPKTPDANAANHAKAETAPKPVQTTSQPSEASRSTAASPAAPVKKDPQESIAANHAKPDAATSNNAKPEVAASNNVKPEVIASNNTKPEAAPKAAKPANVANPLLDAVRWTILAAHQGNVSGDYSKLYARLSPAIQSKLKLEQLAQALKGFRDRRVDLSGVANLEPVFFQAPSQDTQGLHTIAGYFPTKPNAVRFNIGVKPMADGWRIELLNLDLPSPAELAAAIKNAPPPAAAKQATHANGTHGSPPNAGHTPAPANMSAANRTEPAEVREGGNAAAGSATTKIADSTPIKQAQPELVRNYGQPRNPMVDVLRSAILFANLGNLSGDYGHLYSRLSPTAQGKLRPEQLSQVLKEFRDRKVDLLAVTHLEPVFFRAPWVDEQGLTNLAGYFPTKPYPVRFAIALKPIATTWDIEAFSIDMPAAQELAAQKNEQTPASVSITALADDRNATAIANAAAAAASNPLQLNAADAVKGNAAVDSLRSAKAGAANPMSNMLRAIILAANQGNLTGDYSQLYGLLSPAIQSKVRPEQLAQALKGFREKKIDLSGAANLDPVLFRSPWKDPQGTLNLNGYFPTRPQAVRFAIGLKQSADAWRIEALNLDTPSAEELATVLRNAASMAATSPATATATVTAPTPNPAQAAAKSETPAAPAAAPATTAPAQAVANAAAPGPAATRSAPTETAQKFGLADNALLDVLRSTLMAANLGNMSGNYTQLYSRLTPTLQTNLRLDQLAQALREFRDRRIDLSEVTTLEPVMFRPPWEDVQGLINLSGYFPTKPQAVRFTLALKRAADGWRIEGLNLDVPSSEELAAAVKTGQAAMAAQKATQTIGSVNKPKNFDSSHLDWTTDPPTATKW